MHIGGAFNIPPRASVLPMPETYKVYLLERSNLVVAVHFVVAENEKEAVEAARQLPGSQTREVWYGERRVAIIELVPSDEPKGSLWL